MFQLICFDIDDTLTQSKQQISREMADLLSALSHFYKVSIVSWWDFPQFEKQILSHLPKHTNFTNMILAPTCGTKLYVYENTAWKKIFSLALSQEEKQHIIHSLHTISKKLGYDKLQTWGNTIEDRETQITYSALWQNAPLEIKKTWDPTWEKRKTLKNLLQPLLPEYDIHLWWTTSLDILKKGIDKSFWVQKLLEYTRFPLNSVLFVGDSVFDSGNDYAPLHKLGIITKKVFSLEDTKILISDLIREKQGC